MSKKPPATSALVKPLFLGALKGLSIAVIASIIMAACPVLLVFGFTGLDKNLHVVGTAPSFFTVAFFATLLWSGPLSVIVGMVLAMWFRRPSVQLKLSTKYAFRMGALFGGLGGFLVTLFFWLAPREYFSGLLPIAVFGILLSSLAGGVAGLWVIKT